MIKTILKDKPFAYPELVRFAKEVTDMEGNYNKADTGTGLKENYDS